MHRPAGWAIWTVPLLCAACSASAPVAPAARAVPVPTVELSVWPGIGPVAIRHASIVGFTVPESPVDAVYAIDFGDGQTGQMEVSPSISAALTHHRYDSNGTFTARVTILDASDGRQLAVGSATCTIGDMNGIWSNNTVNAVTNKTETRRFQFVQTDDALSGQYFGPDGTAQAIEGLVGPARSIEIRRDGRQIAYGRDLNYFESGGGVNGDLSAFTVFFHDGTLPDRPVTFTRQ